MNHFQCSPSYLDDCTHLATVLLHPGFAKWLSSRLHLFILGLPLWKTKSGRVQPIINDAIGIFLSGGANFSWSVTSDLI